MSSSRFSKQNASAYYLNASAYYLGCFAGLDGLLEWYESTEERFLGVSDTVIG